MDGWQPTDTFKGVDHGTLEEVDRFIEALGSDTCYGSDGACYVPSKDWILMPNRAEFYDTKHGSALEGFYAVLLHEHVHWTGYKSRLDRDLSGRFGSQSYALEELVAELGAAYLSISTRGGNSMARQGKQEEITPKHVGIWLRVSTDDQVRGE